MIQLSIPFDLVPYSSSFSGLLISVFIWLFPKFSLEFPTNLEISNHIITITIFNNPKQKDLRGLSPKATKLLKELRETLRNSKELQESKIFENISKNLKN